MAARIKAIRVEIRPGPFNNDGSMLTVDVKTWDDKVYTVAELIPVDHTESLFDMLTQHAIAKLKRRLKFETDDPVARVERMAAGGTSFGASD